MTINEWNNRGDYKQAWKAFCRSEAGKALKQVLFSLGAPIPIMPPVGVDFIDWNASLNARREGFFEAIRVLESLYVDKTESEELPAPWEKEENQWENKEQ